VPGPRTIVGGLRASRAAPASAPARPGDGRRMLALLPRGGRRRVRHQVYRRTSATGGSSWAGAVIGAKSFLRPVMP